MQVRSHKFVKARGEGECGTGVLQNFDKHFVKNTRKRGPAAKHFGVFLQDTLKTTFWIKNLTQGGHKAFLSKIRTLFSILKKSRETFPLPSSCAPVSVIVYASISLNMPKYPWKCLNKLFWLCQGSEYVWSSYMFDRLLKMNWVLNKPGFWIWHDCICKGYPEFRICLIMASYASIMPEYVWICLNPLNMPGHGYFWMSLNMPECLWICLMNCSTVPEFSICHDIVIT